MHLYVYYGLQSNGEKTEVAVELSLSELLLKTSVFIRTTEQIPHRFLVLWPGFPVALVFLVKTKNLICQHFMKDMVLPCNPELSWVIKGRPSYRLALSLLTPIPLRIRSRDFRRDPIKHSKLHSNFESLTFGLQGRNSSHCTTQMLFLPYLPIFHNMTWFYLVAQKILGLQVRPLTTHSNSSVFALQKQGLQKRPNQAFKAAPKRQSQIHHSITTTFRSSKWRTAELASCCRLYLLLNELALDCPTLG